MRLIRQKVCRTCKAEKPLRQFYRLARRGAGRMSDCKDCKRAYAREMHWLKREAILARKRTYNARPAQIAARMAYAQTPRGREVHREVCRTYRILRRMEARA